ncbi:MAG: FHA domain-containing protein, partial [Deltaproteobacteria bacterium]|nr:FHA domain-containing protein [Deltaproteobacteria bacterium]
MRVTIRILTGARAGQTVVLDEPNLIRLGRRPGNDVQFDVQRDLDVSGNHAEIRREGDTLYLYDIGSANGVFCGDAKIEKIRLTHGQQFSLGAHGPLVQVGVETSSDERATEGQGVSPVAGHAGPSGEGAPIETAADALERRKVASSLGERKIGAKTVAMMIDRAVGVAQAQDTKGRVGKSTVFLRAMVSQAVTQSTRRFKILA